jgi:uncharacterized protein DUF2750
MKITENEIKRVSALEDFKRYEYAIKRIADHTKIYSLKSSEGYWAISTVDENKLFPIWSAPQYAINCAIDGWHDFEVVEIPINTFQSDLMTSIEDEGFLLNVFPVGKDTGFVVDLDEFIRDLRVELEKYE